ncbi:unnamed protein product [Cercopithifilaria johnstoni]|uniref:Uncharacterized protein n=1 Tax=Cercopithifilaria johnstoni TaxID=2874296 RepID=A0A8J2MRE6_9BILA|nr:unnamed protein product [Cercopithifilaria johnstoni]
MSSEGSADQNLCITDNTLGGQHEVDEVKMNKMYTNDSSVLAISLRSLDDDDFRNLLNTAAKPQYGSLQRKRKKSQKTAEYGGRRLSDAGESTGLSEEADNLLAQFRREAELSQQKADIG